MKYNIKSLYNDATVFIFFTYRRVVVCLLLLVILCSTGCTVADCRVSSVYRLLLLRLPAAVLALADCVILKRARDPPKKRRIRILFGYNTL